MQRAKNPGWVVSKPLPSQTSLNALEDELLDLRRNEVPGGCEAANLAGTE